MNTIRFEHHTSDMYINELCPFKIKYMKDCTHIVANWHRNLELIYIVGGSASLRRGSELCTVNKGDALVISPETVHSIYSDKGVDFWFVIADEGFLSENGLFAEKNRFSMHRCDNETKEAIKAVILAYEDMQTNNSQTSVAKIRNAVLSLMIDVFEKYTEVLEVKKENRITGEGYVKKAMQYIGENCGRHITVEEIALKLGITKYYLSREFKKQTGETVISYIGLVRCKRAEQLIMQGHTVTEAALESGFESGSYFSQLYKKIKGIPPSEIKNMPAYHKSTSRSTFDDENDPVS